MSRYCLALLALMMCFGATIQAQSSTTDFVEVELSQNTPYVGEQITYTVRWYSTLDSEIADQADVVWPNFEGFGRITEDYSSTTDRRENTLYSVVILEMTLLPLRTGEIQIEPFRLAVPPSPFQDETIIESVPLNVSVRPLPQNQPDSFVNAIGQFSIQAELDSSQVTLNEQLRYSLTLTGIGNLQQISAPTVAFPSEWRVFDAQPTYQTLATGLGSKQFTWRLIPTQAGDYIIEPMPVTTFNPQQQAYQTLTTAPFNVHVAASDAAITSTRSIPATAAASNSQVPEWVPMSQFIDLRIVNAPLFWLLWLIPLVLVGGLWAINRLQSRKPTSRNKIVGVRALRRQISAVSTDDEKQACETMLKLLQASALSLHEEPWPHMVKQLENARFAPASTYSAEIYKQQILNELKR
ncbi:BatD family protein [Phototrophicus methaneseepsis]|uniref:BatD family protein n=1 Tax=Phototrophicus methaneseepsis TaxID=2710758 RepID=A0A7S8E6E4_9CHLR|nr:BatD family protein [Phototrophicus methaneseepsis]QPC81139.1 BatD family protein [Phototrophicus methaneseepsis]